MKKKRVLIVEDEPIVALSLKNTLESSGYLVGSLVSTGEDAIQKAEAEKPDLILMDIKLRGRVDGVEAATAIRGRFNIPIIHLTAYEDEEVAEKIRLTGSSGCLPKPFEEADLKAMIASVLRKTA
ncbi:MAG: response regulator [Candidatus Omnitrophota bacterium]